MFTTTKLCCNAFGLTSSHLASSHRPFPDLDQEASCPSALAFTCQCRRARAHARAALCRATDHYFTLANHQRSLAPAHQFGQRVWLPTKDLGLPKYSKKLALRFAGSFTINQVFRPPVRSENWPSYVRIYPACHVSKIKPGSQEPPEHSSTSVCMHHRRGHCVRRPSPAPLLSPKKGIQYLVDWEGCKPEERSWVSFHCIGDLFLI